MGTKGTHWSAERRAKAEASIQPLAKRIMDRIEFDPNGGCWLWAGAMVRSTGYGTIGYNGRTHGAHRMAFLALRGEDPGDLLVCHRCDVRCCVNPDHLFLGTVRDNTQDMLRKGRGSRRDGDAAPNAILRERDIPIIRRRIASGETNRAIGSTFGVSPDVINAIRVGRSWRKVGAAA